MSHWKWRETKLQPSRARSGHQISCCLVSLHFLCDILAPITVGYFKTELNLPNQTYLSTPKTMSECAPLAEQLLPRLQSARMKWKCAESEWNEVYIACRSSEGKAVEEEDSRGNKAKLGMGGSEANSPRSAQLSGSC